MLDYSSTLLEADSLNERAYALRLSNPQLAKSLAEQARDKSLHIDYPYGHACALRSLAAASVEQSLTNAFALAVHAIEIFATLGKREETSSALMPIFCYFVQNDRFDRARSTLQEALTISESINDKHSMSLIYYNFGWLACKEGESERAREFFEKSIELGSHGVNDWSYWRSRTRLIGLLAEQAKESVESEWQKAIELLFVDVSATGNLLALSEVLCVHIDACARAGRRAEVIAAVRRARQRTELFKDESCRAKLMYAHANALLLIGDEKRYISRLRRTATALEKANLKVRLGKMLFQLAIAEQKAGLFDQSANHFRQHIELQRHLQASDAEYRLNEVIHEALAKHLRGQLDSAVSKSDQLIEMNQRLQFSLEQQTLLQRELTRIASTDELTGAVNRRQIVNDGILEMERYRHTGSPFSVTVIDVDHFKSINDSFGHATGDEVLRRLTKCCQALLRRFDVFGRLGGEEFCIVHHDTDLHGAQMAVKRVMDAVGKMFTADILPDREFSVSMGVAEVHEADASFYDVLHHADMALFEAKRAGRNTYRLAQSRTLEAA